MRRSNWFVPALLLGLGGCASSGGAQGTADAGTMVDSGGAGDAAVLDASAPDGTQDAGPPIACNPEWAVTGEESDCPSGWGCLLLTRTCVNHDAGESCASEPTGIGLEVVAGWSDPGAVTAEGLVAAMVVGRASGQPTFGLLVELADGRELAITVRAPALAVKEGDAVSLRLQRAELYCHSPLLLELRSPDGGLLLHGRIDAEGVVESDASPFHLSLTGGACFQQYWGYCDVSLAAGVELQTPDGSSTVARPWTSTPITWEGGSFVLHALGSRLVADPCATDCANADVMDALLLRDAAPPSLPAAPAEPGPVTEPPAPDLPAASWLEIAGTAGADDLYDMAAAPDGSLVVVGRAGEAGLAYDGVPLEVAWLPGPFAMGIGADGAVSWATGYSTAAGTGGSYAQVAVGPDGRIAATTSDSTTLRVARLAADGTLEASLACSGPGSARGLAMRPDGVALVVGSFLQHGIGCDGAEELTGLGWEGFVLAVDPSGGAAWTRLFGGADNEDLTAVAANADGTAWVAGTFKSPTLIVGASTHHALGGTAVLLAKLDAAGEPLLSRSFLPMSSLVTVYALQGGPDGGVTLVGKAAGANLDLGGGPLDGGSSGSLFVGRFDAGGQHVWSRSIGGAGQETAVDAAMAGDDLWILVGNRSTAFSFGGVAIPGRQDYRATGLVALNAQGEPAGAMAWKLPSWGETSAIAGLPDGTLAMGGTVDSWPMRRTIGGREVPPQSSVQIFFTLFGAP